MDAITPVEDRLPKKKKGSVKRRLDRKTDLSVYDDIVDQLDDLYPTVEKGFEDQYQRSNDIIDYWDIYNSKLGPAQFYSGNSKIFIPIVHNAVEARKTRFVNQIFPMSNRNVDLITTDNAKPENYIALIEHYILLAKLREQIMPALVKNGDIEGQYSIYVSWRKSKRHITLRTKKSAVANPEEEDTEAQIPIPGEDVDDIEQDVIQDGHPEVEVISDADLLVLPTTADSIENALRDGGSVTVLRRWGKAKIKQLIRDKIINKEAGEDLLETMSGSKKAGTNKVNTANEMVDAAGIKTESGSKHALIYEVWSELEVAPGERRLCVSYLGGEQRVLGCHINPNWSDRCSVISCAADKVKGSFKGISRIKPCCDMQYFANDAVNEAADSLTYSLLPITMTDPEKNPRLGSMVLAVGAVWETSPNDTQFAKMPSVWADAFAAISSAKEMIAETLGVNPAAITQVTSTKKRNQAEIANEQQVDILSTADAVTTIERGILTPMLNMFAELDYQNRDEEALVNAYGELGLKAAMVEVSPIRMEKGYYFKWFGVEAARTAQQIQLQIGSLNIIRTVPPQMYQGWKIDIVPVLQQLFENLFGPRLASQIFKDMAEELTLDPEFENNLLDEGIPIPVHMMDNDAEHVKIHTQAVQQNGDHSGQIRAHIMRHEQQARMKEAAQQQQQMAQQQAQMGGGQPPRAGAVPGAQRGGQAPAGAIHQDRMQDPGRAPRR